jgi:hypothetical protein
VGGVQQVGSKWDGELGCLEIEGVQVEVPTALAHLSANHDPWNYDSSGFGPGMNLIAENRSILMSELAGNYLLIVIQSVALLMVLIVCNQFSFCPWVFFVDCW